MSEKNRKKMMKLQDWHTHNSLCRHAIGSLEDYVKKAIEINLNIIGFSDHFPYEYLEGVEEIPIDEYGMRLNEIESYLSTAEKLKDKYRSQLDIKIGFEIDYIENQIDRLNTHLNKIKSRLDYILGSIHVLYSEDGPWAMDDHRFLEQYNSLGSKNVFLQYYSTLQKMIKTKEFDFDIISHFDLPKKFNKLPSKDSKDLIANKVSKLLDLVKKRDLVVEINTAGFRKEVREQYPSKDIIKNMYELDIPILLSSDAHEPNELAYEFKKVIQLLKDLGYNQLATFNKRKRTFIEI
ncbi:MAG: histidinol-phosphatase HisJ [Promethearchaeota archaeon]